MYIHPGLAVIQAAVIRKASRIFAIDVNSAKFPTAQAFGATDCINPKVNTVLIYYNCILYTSSILYNA